MISLSVVLATYNEEETLADCLDSVKNLADEIVVVDGTSSDRTVEIAKKFKATVIVTDNPPIFHINKQKAIDAAKGEWILQLDADERLTKELSEEIEGIITNNQLPITNNQLKNKLENQRTSQPENQLTSQLINGYWIPRKNYFLGRFLAKGGQYPDYTMRLYKKGKGKLPSKDVHEQAVVDGNVGYLKNDLIHIADPTFERYLHRFNRYTSLIATELTKETSQSEFLKGLSYFVVKPIHWFLITYIRHRGYVDGFPGFVFSLFSSLRFPVAYIKYWEKTYAHSN